MNVLRSENILSTLHGHHSFIYIICGALYFIISRNIHVCGYIVYTLRYWFMSMRQRYVCMCCAYVVEETFCVDESALSYDNFLQFFMKTEMNELREWPI